MSDSANPQFIRGQFQGDFGFDSLVEYEVTPDLLTSAAFNLVLPDDHVIGPDHGARAPLGPWPPRCATPKAPISPPRPGSPTHDTVQITLSPTEGQKVIYVQYRNDWTLSGTLTDYVIHVTQPAEISFWAPLDGDVDQRRRGVPGPRRQHCGFGELDRWFWSSSIPATGTDS